MHNVWSCTLRQCRSINTVQFNEGILVLSLQNNFLKFSCYLIWLSFVPHMLGTASQKTWGMFSYLLHSNPFLQPNFSMKTDNRPWSSSSIVVCTCNWNITYIFSLPLLYFPFCVYLSFWSPSDMQDAHDRDINFQSMLNSIRNWWCYKC